MSILSDKQIRALCVCPDTITVTPVNPNKVSNGMSTLIHYDPTPYTRPTTAEERALFRPMIAPFSAALVRTVQEPLGMVVTATGYGESGPTTTDTRERKIISRGTTSFGYDVALSDKEVKLFSNLNGQLIDPKRMDTNCLVDAQQYIDTDGAKYVILPPNSYLLGVTTETFDIPRDVMVVCLGKSTYARAGLIVNVTPIEPGFRGTVVIEISNSTPLPAKVYLNEGISQFLFFQGSEPCETSYGDRGGKYQDQTGVTLPKV